MKEKIKSIIYDAVDQFNDQNQHENHLDKDIETVLFGEEGNLDSLGLVTILVLIEQNIEDEFDVSIAIADEKAMSQKESPFKTIRTLVDYINLLLKDS